MLVCIEGENGTGKSTLISKLEDIYTEWFCGYSISSIYKDQLKKMPKTRNKERKFYRYLFASILTLMDTQHHSNRILDRSILSTMANFLAHQKRAVRQKYFSKFATIEKALPKCDLCIILTVSEEKRLERIDKKVGEARQADIISIPYEKKKQQYRLLLAKHFRWPVISIDTSNLSPEEVADKVRRQIDKFKARVL